MSDLEVLMVSMNQLDMSILEKSNIQSNAVLSNQSDNLINMTEKTKDNEWKMITTNTRGVGINRNIGLNHASGPYCLFMDDDMKCVDNYQSVILKYFEEIPDADILIFNIKTIGDDLGRRTNTSIKRVRLCNFMNYGTVRIAFKLDSIKRENIQFNTLFGGGCLYSSGEDTIFLKNCLSAGLKIYTVPYCYAEVSQENSTWYKGTNEKYIYDKGALMAAMFKKSYILFDFIFAVKLSNKINLGKFDCFKLLYAGSKNYKHLITYNKYIDK